MMISRSREAEKQETERKQMRTAKSTARSISKHGIWYFGFRILNLFRMACFGFRICSLPLCLSASLLPPVTAGAAQVENKVVAIVNDEVMTQLDLEVALFDQAGTPLAQLSHDERVQAAVQQLLEERLILQAAKQAKVTVEDRTVEERLAAARRRFESDTAFDDALMAEGLTRAMLRARYRDNLMMQRVVEQEVRAKTVVTPNEMARYYEAHPDEMRSAPRVRARHLLIRTTPERPSAEALSVIEGLRRKMGDGKTTFADVARVSSEGPEAAQSGDMGWVTPGQLRPELDEALFRLQPGIVSDPILTDVGYHLVQVNEREPVQTWPFEQVEASIREKLMRQKFERKLAQWLADLRAKAYIVVK